MTLLETLVVVAVTAIVATISFPRVERAFTTFAVREETMALVANLRFAHAQAMRTGGKIAFSIASDGHGYGWTGSNLRSLQGPVELTPVNAQVVFFPDGSSSGGMLIVATPMGRYPVRVDAATGGVSMGQP